jgi:guanylate kinase
MSGILFIISAPSGSGKTTLTNELLRLVPGLEFSISYTTRPPRGSEQDGRDYHFINRHQFDEMLRQEAFLEHANVFGHCYGTAKRFLQAARHADKDLVLDIDVQGAAQVKQKLPDAVSIFILPPSRQVLEGRLRRRSQAENANFEDVIRRRLAGARKEIENYGNYDYILVNDRLEDSIEQLKAIVAAERLRHCHTTPSGQAAEFVRQAERCRLANVRSRAEQILRSFDEPGAGGPP